MATKSVKRRSGAAAKKTRRESKPAVSAKPKAQGTRKPARQKVAVVAAKPAAKKAIAPKTAVRREPVSKPTATSALGAKADSKAKADSNRTSPPPKASTSAKPKRAGRRIEFEEFRRTLVERQQELIRAYSESKGDSRAHLGSGTEDYIDYAVSSYAKEFLLSLTEMDRKQLMMVEEALVRVAKGEYGHCLQCGEEIAHKRLEVAPWVRYCVRCQGLEEQGLLPEHSGRLDGEEADDEGGEDLPVPDLEGDLAADDAEDLEEEPLGVDEDDAVEADEN